MLAPFQEKHIPGVIGIGRNMHAASTFRTLEYSENHLAGFLRAVIDLDHLAGYVWEVEGEVEGVALMGVVPCFFGPDLVATDFVLYLEPAFRGGHTAKQLVQACVDWALAAGARRVNMGNSAGTPDPAYVSLLEGEGFRRAGSLLYLDAPE